MPPYKANLLNGIVLLIVGVLGYFSITSNSNTEFSPTVFIAPAFGLLFLLLTPGMKKENKVVSHLIVLLTFLLGAMLMIMFIKRLSTGSSITEPGMMRFLIMIISCFTAMVVFMGSFRKARNK